MPIFPGISDDLLLRVFGTAEYVTSSPDSSEPSMLVDVQRYRCGCSVTRRRDERTWRAECSDDCAEHCRRPWSGERSQVFAQLERNGDEVLCRVCRELVAHAGICIGPLLTPEGELWQGDPKFDLQGRSLWVRCSNGHETPIDRGRLGRLHPQSSAPAADFPGFIVR